MYIHSRQITQATMISLVLTSCIMAGQRTDFSESLDECSVDQSCSLSGRLEIISGYPSSVGVLRLEKECITLALPPNILRDKNRWNNEMVVLSGSVYSHESAEAVISYTLIDREVATGLCDPNRVVYVQSIER